MNLDLVKENIALKIKLENTYKYWIEESNKYQELKIKYKELTIELEQIKINLLSNPNLYNSNENSNLKSI